MLTYKINKDATVAIKISANKLNTTSLVTLITQLQSIYRELENYKQLPGAQVRSRRIDGSAVKPRGPQVRSKPKPKKGTKQGVYNALFASAGKKPKKK
jgi:hypothetical protein